MNMKVYPLIYSRILNDDYPNGFLARPKDLDVSAASKYVIPAIENIQHAGGVRHAVFPAGDYLVYGGVACVSGNLVERILQSKVIDFAYEEYQADKAGRPLIFFIGFAVRKYELVRNELPDIDLYSTYKIYLSYLVRQWRSEKAATDFSEELEIKSRPYSRKPAPQSLPAGGKRILRNYREDDFQETIDYHFACMAWGSGGDFSFLSNVLPDDAARSPFANISPYDCTPEECARRMEASGVSASYVPPAAYSGSKLRTNNVLNSTIAGMPDGSSGTRPASSGIEKKNSNGKFLPVVGILAAAAIIALLLFLTKPKNAEPKNAEASHPSQTAHTARCLVDLGRPLKSLRPPMPPHPEEKQDAARTIKSEPEDPLEEFLLDSLEEITAEAPGTPENIAGKNRSRLKIFLTNIRNSKYC